jgi:hypothetical protein
MNDFMMTWILWEDGFFLVKKVQDILDFLIFINPNI